MAWQHLGFIDQAKELDYRVKKALSVMKAEDKTGESPEESEVSFRLASIQGILIMCHNDIAEMIKEWEREP